MMKKLLCMALALALLCGSALAEANQAVVTFSANTTQLVELLTQSGVDGNVKLLAQGLKELCEGLRLEFQWQDNAFWGNMCLADTTLVDLAYFCSDEGLLQLTTSLLPQHYMACQLTEADMAQSREAASTMADTDWQAVADELAAAAQSWWNELPCQESEGRFMGDAYDGGTRCVSRCFDDADLARAVDMLSSVLQQHGVDDGFLEAYSGQQNIWASVQVANQAAAQANRYQYTVKQVYGDTGALVGLSLVVLDGETQVTTASLGVNESGKKVVLGWGKDERNYYLCLETFPEDADLDWTALLYQDPQRLGFPMVETLPSYLLWLAGGSLTQQAENAWRLDMELIDLYADNALLQDLYIRIDATQTAESAVLDASLFLPDGEDVSAANPVFGVNVTVQSADERAWSVENRQRLDLESTHELGAETEAVMSQELQQSLDTLLVQLFKVLPSQLITFMMQLYAD